jgi:hypothetical protein
VVRAQRNEYAERAATRQTQLRESQQALRMAGADVAALRETVAASLGLPDLSELGSPWGRGPRDSSDSDDSDTGSPRRGGLPQRSLHKGILGEISTAKDGGGARRVLLPQPCSPEHRQSKSPAKAQRAVLTPAAQCKGEVVDGAMDGRSESSPLVRFSLTSADSGHDTLADKENSPPPAVRMDGTAPPISQVRLQSAVLLAQPYARAALRAVQALAITKSSLLRRRLDCEPAGGATSVASQ